MFVDWLYLLIFLFKFWLCFFFSWLVIVEFELAQVIADVKTRRRRIVGVAFGAPAACSGQALMETMVTEDAASLVPCSIK